MGLDEYYIINDIYLFELVGRLSSSIRQGAYLQVCLVDGTDQCKLPTLNGEEREEEECTVEAQIFTNAPKVTLEYLVNGQAMEFTEFNFIIGDNCGAAIVGQ